MTTATMTDAECYLAAVRAHLADVADPEREELLEDLEQHLAEVAAEAGGSLEEQLGPPAEYAAELRASAGLAAAPRRSRLEALVARDVARLKTIRHHPLLAQARTRLRELRPAWLIGRAYLIVVAYSMTGYGPGPAFPLPRYVGSRLLGLIVLAAAVFASHWVAYRRTIGWRIVNVLVTVAGLLTALYVVSTLNWASASTAAVYDEDGTTISESHADYGGYSPYGEEVSGLQRFDGSPVTNIYPFDAGGRPLTDVRLFDQDGKPVDIVVEATPRGRRVLTSFPTDAAGRPVTNAFPQQQALQRSGGGGDAFGTPPQLSVPPLVPRASERAELMPETSTRRPDRRRR